MNKIKHTEKTAIFTALQGYVAKYPSRAKAANALEISSATMSALMKEKWELISDEMWRTIGVKVGYNACVWKLVETGAFADITTALTNAQEERNTLWIVGEAGCGKTTTARAYEGEHSETYYVLCAEDMKKGDFVREIAQRVGCKTSGRNIREMWSDILDTLYQMDAPLLIFDEADKLTDSVFSYFISMYNRLEDHAGMAFLSTDYICHRIKNGLRYEKRGYKEFYSRIGRKFFELEATTATDVIGICRANGISDDWALRRIVEETAGCEYDLRRVKKSIKRTLKQRG